MLTPLRGEAARQVAHDAGPVDAGQFQLDHAPACRGGRRFAFRDDDAQSRRFEAAQRLRERFSVLCRHFEVHHPGKLPGEIRHAAAGPIGAESLRRDRTAG